MPSTVFLTGASGFVGSAVLEELLSRGYFVNALQSRKPVSLRHDRLHPIPGDLFNPATLHNAMSGCSAVIHLVGIIMERRSKNITFDRIHYQGAVNVVDAAKSSGIQRYIHMSALGVRQDAVSAYHQTKYKAEQYIRSSGLDWTIFRPSMIHGPAGEFMQMEAAWTRRRKAPFLFMPYFGRGLLGLGGAGKLQPIYVNDVARAFVDALEKPKTIGEIYPLAGPDELTWPQLHRAAAQAIVGRKRTVIPIPAWYAKTLAAVLPARLLPFNRDQVIMSQENNTCDITKFRQDFTWDPEPFEPTLKSYSAQL